MTHRSGNLVIVNLTAPRKCSDCGELDELRPYGKDGAWVCFKCGMKDEDEAKVQFSKLFNGERDI